MCEEIKFNTSELFKINDLNQFKEILEISIVFFQGTHLGQKPCNGAFTLPNTETEIDTDSYKMGTKLKGNLCWYLSLYSRNTFTQFNASHFYRSPYHPRCRAV